jgi:hypothetical protein
MGYLCRIPICSRLANPTEAHIYLNPNELLGTGSHSAVYLAEWEAQRLFLVREKLCTSCVLEEVEVILCEDDGKKGERSEVG